MLYDGHNDGIYLPHKGVSYIYIKKKCHCTLNTNKTFNFNKFFFNIMA